MYLDKQECYNDILHSLRLRYLLQFYKDTENYECCQGVMEAYAEFKKERNEIKTD